MLRLFARNEVVCEIVAAILVLYVYKGKISTEAKTFMKKTITDDYRVNGELSWLSGQWIISRYFQGLRTV